MLGIDALVGNKKQHTTKDYVWLTVVLATLVYTFLYWPVWCAAHAPLRMLFPQFYTSHVVEPKHTNCVAVLKAHREGVICVSGIIHVELGSVLIGINLLVRKRRITSQCWELTVMQTAASSNVRTAR